MKVRRFDPARAPQDQRKYSPTVGPALSPAMHNECDLTHIPNLLTVVTTCVRMNGLFYEGGAAASFAQVNRICDAFAAHVRASL